ncbi:MAG TPA: hypothetical protein VEC43_01820 [Candidatus Acidoferrales bacterium]|nr:hypothetical protein [Candidatus Acidoferrales bacterium]
MQQDLPKLCEKLVKSVKLDHLFALTDATAVIQHARFSVPYKKEGYAVDDNARALVFSVKAPQYWPDDRLAELQKKLLSFLLLMQDDNGQLHNFMDFSLDLIGKPAIGDHLGRTLWATGAILNSGVAEGMKAPARLVFDRALPWARVSDSLRTKAYACLALHERMLAEPDDKNLETDLKEISADLLKAYEVNKDGAWQWYENILSYDNPRLSQAMLVGYELLHDEVLLNAGEETLRFLNNAETQNGICTPIGNNGWYTKGKAKALYDQQPIEPGAMVEAAAIAYRLTHDRSYEDMARQALGWFFSMNTKNVIVYDAASGACYDGVGERGLNQNQGAESTIAFLLAAEEFLTCFGQVE